MWSCCGRKLWRGVRQSLYIWCQLNTEVQLQLFFFFKPTAASESLTEKRQQITSPSLSLSVCVLEGGGRIV